jgi:hypothetical protein
MNKENNQSNSTLKVILKKYWWIVAISLIAPIAINYALLIPAFAPVVGTNIDWLSFFGNYIAAIIPALGAFIILFIQREDNHKENEQNRQLQINVLKYQQEMQWLSEKREILIDYALTFSRDHLNNIANKMWDNQKVIYDIKSLMLTFMKNDSRVIFMRVSEETDEYKALWDQRSAAFPVYRQALIDLQRIYNLFSIVDCSKRKQILEQSLKDGLISDELQKIISSYNTQNAFLIQKSSDIAFKLIASLPSDLLKNTREAAFNYIKAEEIRISKFITE